MAVKIITENEFFELFSKPDQDAIKIQIMQNLPPQAIKFIEGLAIGKSGTDIVYMRLSKAQEPGDFKYFRMKRIYTVLDRKQVPNQAGVDVWLSPLAMRLEEVHWFDNKEEYFHRRNAEMLSQPSMINQN